MTPDYVIGPGDELLIRTWGQLTQSLHLTVDRSGSVYVPQVGELRVAGLQFGVRSVKESNIAIAPIGVHKPW